MGIGKEVQVKGSTDHFTGAACRPPSLLLLSYAGMNYRRADQSTDEYIVEFEPLRRKQNPRWRWARDFQDNPFRFRA